MNFVRLAWRTLLVVAVFVGVGLATTQAVVTYTNAGGSAVAEVRLAAMMAGLFAGGAATAVVILVLSLGRRRG